MKPIDDPRFAEAVRLFEREHVKLRQAEDLLAVAHSLHVHATNAKPSPQTRYSTMAKLREQVFARLDAERKAQSVPFG